MKIGTPGYKVLKQRDPLTKQLSLLFQIEYDQIEKGLQPRQRFVSSLQQKVEKKDPRFQYIVFAAKPYDNIAFKIPTNHCIDRDQSKMFSHWNKETKCFTFQLYFTKK